MTSNALKGQKVGNRKVGKRNPADLIPPFKDIEEDRAATLEAANNALTSKLPGHRLPFTVEGYKHAASDGLAAGIKDADGLWVAKMHPLNGTTEDLERSRKLAHVFAAAPAMFAALKRLSRAGTMNDQGAIDEMRAAIAMAETDS